MPPRSPFVAVRSRVRAAAAHARRSRLDAAELRGAGIEARAFAGLTAASLAFAAPRFENGTRKLNLVVPDATPWRRFAGVDTAFAVARAIAGRMGVPLRVIETNLVTRSNAERRRMGREFSGWDAPADLVERGDIRGTAFGADDVWLATHWTTAHALAVATRLGRLDPARIVYLIQDFEPGFSAWSSDYVLAAETYSAGFLPLVNSTPVAEVLHLETGIAVEPALVFAPALDLDRLAEIAARRTEHDAVCVMFYARPSKPRNLYPLGTAALRRALDEVGGSRVEIVAAGEAVPAADAWLHPVGRLSWDGYFDQLARTDVALSLQLSAHPSHPPLEAAISGALAVTNEFRGTRAGLHPRLTAAPATVDGLAAALVDAVRRAPDRSRGFAPLAPGALGVAFDDALDTVVGRLPT